MGDEGKQFVLVLVVICSWIYCLNYLQEKPPVSLDEETYEIPQAFQEFIQKSLENRGKKEGSLPSVVFDREKMTLVGGRYCEGYWNNPDTPEPLKDDLGQPLPEPTSKGKWALTQKMQFLSALNAVEESDFVQIIAYRGLSPCRTCEELNGSEEYVLQPQYLPKMGGEGKGEKEGERKREGEGREVCWPAGYEHYVKEHGVIPSKQFYDIIMKLVF